MKKVKNKGFTLMELIAVIVILGIIAVLAMVSVSTVRSRVNEREYESLASKIEVAAENYAEETGVNKMFVQTLIDKGLIEADDETKQIYDPRNEESINCQVINYSNGKATLEQAENPLCDITVLNDEAIKIQYRLNNDTSNKKQDLKGDKWFNQGVTLSVDTTGLVSVDLASASYSWSSPVAPDKVETGKELVIDDKYVNDIFQVTVKVGNNKYTAYGNVKIDREPPKVYNLIDENPENWSTKKNLSFELSDAESGIYGYQITYDTKEPTTWTKVDPSGKTSEKVKVTKDLKTLKEGDYIYVWVKDVVGNINKSEVTPNGSASLQINNMDVGFDSVTLTGTPDNNTYSQSVTLTGTVEDQKSGVVAWMCTKTNKTPSASDKGWKTITRTNSKTNVTCPTSAAENGEYYLYAKDNVENIGKASYKVENVDKTIDSVKISDTKSGYRESTILSGTALDTKAGIVGYAFTTSSSKPSTFTNITKTKNEVTFYYDKADENITYYFHVIDAAGNWNHDSVKVENIVEERTYPGNLFSYSSSNIEDQIELDELDNPVEIVSSTTDQGYISASLSDSDSYAYVRVYGGQNNPQPYTGTCSSTSYLNTYAASLTCSTGYYCPDGGTAGSDGWCYPTKTRITDECGHTYYLDDEYELSTCPIPYQHFTCINGTWTQVDDNYGATPCEVGYVRIKLPEKPKDYYDCTSPEGACSPDGSTNDGKYGCHATCKFTKYPASCSGNKDYACKSGDYRDDSDCYSCSRGSYSNGTCNYSCTLFRDYWEYNITINYYVIK